jgi:glutamate-1-semialdehyde 2,1-aminomutase
MNDTYLFAALALAAAGLIPRARRRIQLSLAKQPGLTGHPRLARRVSRLIRHYSFDEVRFAAVDGAPESVVQARRAGFSRLSATFGACFARSASLTREAAPMISDLQFTSSYRVPFPFSALVRQHLQGGAFIERADGVFVTDLDGNRLYDLTGSYGVNLLGHDFYRGSMARGQQQAEPMGMVLGPYHPLVLDNVRRILAVSGHEEVSFHMSGTEAVMQAVRLARYHTGRTHLVRFCGAYHGWWGDVQPGVGNPQTAHETYTLREMHAATLRVLRARTDIACVLVNPLQALHPNVAAPGDSSLVDGSRRAGFDRAAYTAWLTELRKVCTERGIVLIFDEVFLGFRLARGGAQEYFGVRADMVTYGKTIGGGLPIGVVSGSHALMRRFNPDRPADISFARGTFNAHPQVMAAMNEFLVALDSAEVSARYDGLDERWNARAQRMNARLEQAGLPVRVANLSSVFCVTYAQPSRYHWMYQFYLRAAGCALSWVGTGRLIFSLDYTEADFDGVIERFVAAGRDMQRDGWWWLSSDASFGKIRKALLLEMLAAWRAPRRADGEIRAG